MKRITQSDHKLILALALNHRTSYREQFPTYCANTTLKMFVEKAVDEVERFDVFISDDLCSHLVLEDYTDPCVDPDLRVYYVRKMYTLSSVRGEGRMKDLISKAKVILNTENVFSEVDVHRW